MSILGFATVVCDLGQTAQTPLWASVFSSVDGAGSPMPETPGLCRYWCHGERKEQDCPGSCKPIDSQYLYVLSDTQIRQVDN